MKVGKDRGASWRQDLERVRAVRDAIGSNVELFVDANGAYDRSLARRCGAAFADLDVRWFEEPVSSDDLDGLAELRAALPMDVTAGEYGYDLGYFRRMLDARSVDVLQADAGRCAGITEWLRAAACAAAFEVPFSAHCGPSLHVHAACAPPNLRHVEWFHDHVRIEAMLFDGALSPVDGRLSPTDRPGNGLSLRSREAKRFAA
jgi:L-alanine-DL-glutamate epimerase-like enolase superfamily enzyme